MNKDILIERIEYLSSMPHSNLVQHCIYLENENANYKAQKYITDFISENGIICEKNKEIERLTAESTEWESKCYKYQDIIDTLEEWAKESAIYEPYVYNGLLDKLKELKEGKE